MDTRTAWAKEYISRISKIQWIIYMMSEATILTPNIGNWYLLELNRTRRHYDNERIIILHYPQLIGISLINVA